MHVGTNQFWAVDGQGPQQMPVAKPIKWGGVIVVLQSLGEDRHAGFGLGGQQFFGDQAGLDMFDSFESSPPGE